MQLDERFNQEGLGRLAMLEQQLLSGEISEVVELYPELDAQLLPVQLAMLKANNKFNTIQEVSNILKAMVPEVRRLFPQVEALVRLLLVVPVSSCGAELQCPASFEELAPLHDGAVTTQQCVCRPCPQGEAGENNETENSHCLHWHIGEA